MCSQMCKKNCSNSRWCLPCWLLLALAALWTLGSWYWFTCVFMSTCSVPEMKVADKMVTPAPVTTPTATWADISANPITLYFEANSDKALTQDVDAKLADMVNYMKANPTAQVMVTGHTNTHSSQAYTNQLGLERANATKDMLVALGAPSGQIVTESKGQTQLAASPVTAEGRYLNRRVVISVIE
jgi:outer membrane protein OmpA-like peptidoglycan-associated protein